MGPFGIPGWYQFESNLSPDGVELESVCGLSRVLLVMFRVCLSTVVLGQKSSSLGPIWDKLESTLGCQGTLPSVTNKKVPKPISTKFCLSSV